MYIILVSNYNGFKREAINLIPHIIHETIKPSHIKNSKPCKSKTIQINKLTNTPGHLDIFWLYFNKANHSFLHSFLLGGNNFSKYSAWSFDWGIGAWVKIHRFNAFSRNVNTIKLKKFSHTWWNIQVRENSTSILEREKTLTSLKKYERMYHWG